MDQREPPLSADLLTRRRFLGVGAGLVSGSMLASRAESSSEPELTVSSGDPRPRVVKVRSQDAIDGTTVHPAMIAEAMDEALTMFTGAPDARQAWRSILRADDVIGIKFNRSGQAALGTTTGVASALIESLIASGFAPERIICIEAPSGVESSYGTTPAASGYAAAETDFGSGRDQLALVLRQVTAIINVPFLKTHNIAGLTCSLKNLTHAFVKHPARYHANGCSPYIADIAALPQIRGKLRFCLVDALRIVYDGGPTANAGTIGDEGVFLAASDPVALDTVGLELLNERRRRAGLAPVAPSAAHVPYLAAAHRKRLGIAVRHAIDVKRRRLS